MPTVTVSIGGTRGTGDWYVSNVTIGATVSNAGPSGASAVCTPTSVTTDTPSAGYSCVATSGAGRSATKTGTIQRDATKPIIAFGGNAGAYTVEQTVSITCTRSDATSGIASSTCVNTNAPAYTFTVGGTVGNVLTAEATDNAGNTNSAESRFTVSLTGTSFAALVVRLVPDAKTQKQLLNRLENILDKLAKGDETAKQEQVKNFIKELDKAVADGDVTAANAGVLSRLVQMF
jgi:hypothetical protein